ncbi:MAG: SDR family oxidoreductase [candidate division WOR-3 bacterium]
MKDFKNKNFLITGASSGLGKALAYKIAKEGGNILIGSRKREILENIKDEILSKFNVKVITTFLDVTDKNSVKNFIFVALESFDSIDCLINNAGMGLYSKIEDVTDEDFQKLFDLNVKGVFLLTREVIPYMKKQGKGIIVNVSSLAGYVGTPYMSVYAATKFAVRGFTDSLRRELKPFRIKVIGVYPGPFESDFFKNAINKIGAQNVSKNKLMWSNSEKVAEKIIEGIKKGKKNIYIKPLWKVIAKMHDNIPFLFDLFLSSNKYYKNFEN